MGHGGEKVEFNSEWALLGAKSAKYTRRRKFFGEAMCKVKGKQRNKKIYYREISNTCRVPTGRKTKEMERRKMRFLIEEG